MNFEPIMEAISVFGVAPSLADYDKRYGSFTWDQTRAQLVFLLSGGLNIACEAVDRHVTAGLRKTMFSIPVRSPS